MKNNAFILLLLPVVGIGAWVLYLASFTQSAEIITLPVRGYDPRNLLSGHYIQYQIDWERADCNQSNWKGVCPRNAFAGVDRFYVSENRAYALERQINAADVRAEIVFAYRSGHRPIARELVVNQTRISSRLTGELNEQ